MVKLREFRIDTILTGKDYNMYYYCNINKNIEIIHIRFSPSSNTLTSLSLAHNHSFSDEKNYKILLTAALCLLASGFGAQAQTSGGKLKPEQAIMDVRHYTIALNMDFAKKSIDGSTVIDVIMAQPTKVLILDLMDSLHVSAVSVNGKKETFDHKNGLITINTMAKQLPAGKASIKVIYGGQPRIAKNPPWDDGFTWTQDSTGHPWLAVTAEGTGGKIFFPCKDHPS
jgi:hypothetical protein